MEFTAEADVDALDIGIPKAIGDLLSHKLEPDAQDMVDKPCSQKIICAFCRRDFTSSALWFNGWKYPNICGPCGDCASSTGARMGREFWKSVEDPKYLQCICPGCGISKTVDGQFEGGMLSYEGQCSNCGQTWTNVRRVRRKCDSCGQSYVIDEETVSLNCEECKGK